MYAISERINMGFEFEQEKPEITLEDYNDENGTSLTSLSGIQGDQTISYKLKLNNLIKKDSDNEIKVSLIDKKDINENGWSIYADHTQLLGDFKAVKVVGIYEENYDYDSQDTSDYDKYDSMKFGFNFERDFWQREESKVETKLVLGGRFDQKEYETQISDNEKNYKAFGFFETEYENMTFRYGVNYIAEYENVDGSYKKIETEDEEDFTYGVSAEYMYSKDFKVILSYGPVDYFEDNKDYFFEDSGSSYSESQNQASLRIQGKF